MILISCLQQEAQVADRTNANTTRLPSDAVDFSASSEEILTNEGSDNESDALNESEEEEETKSDAGKEETESDEEVQF